MPGSPADEYRRRLQQRRRAHDALSGSDGRLSAVRVATFAVAVSLAVAAWGDVVSYWWLLLPSAAFGVLVIVHDSVTSRREAAARAMAFYERGLARIEDRWHGLGDPGDRFRNDSHLYANDLDLFGRGSLFELLSLARTAAGEETLADWLMRPATVDVVDARQDAVRELAAALDLREALFMAGGRLRTSTDTEGLTSWAEGATWLRPTWLRGVAVLSTTVTLSATAFLLTTGSGGLLVVALSVQLVFAGMLFRRTSEVLRSAENHVRDLDVLRQVLTRLERERFTAPRLAELRRRLDTGGVAASASIDRLRLLVEMNTWQRNMVFGPVGAFLLWGTHLAWAVDAWRRRHGSEVRRWLLTVGEFEAFTSLAAYCYEHPDDPFPQIEPSSTAIFEARDLGHPLLPDARMVRNDVSFAPPTRLFIVSGSNMSGKSTLLRTVGVNTVLALAGAPVRASRLRLSPLSIGATLRIQDSLVEGRSRFSAEITRIGQLADAALRERPLLFLLDELFHGTNSHDRLAGASGVLTVLLERGAIGLVTTHDLALTVIAERMGGSEGAVAATAGASVNVHFDEWFEKGEMRFDYRMKGGPVTRSNALALMRAVGLDVGAPA